MQGRLARDEFDLRVGQALASRTYAELAAITADLPAGSAAAQPPQPARKRGEARDLRPGRMLTAATVLYAGAWPVAFMLPSDSESGFTLLLLATLAYLFVLPVSVGEMVVSRAEKRSGGQLPHKPAAGAGGPVFQRLPSAGQGGRLPPADPGHRHTAEAARRRFSRRSLPGSSSLRRRRSAGYLPQRPAITRIC